MPLTLQLQTNKRVPKNYHFTDGIQNHLAKVIHRIENIEKTSKKLFDCENIFRRLQQSYLNNIERA